MQYYFNALK